MEQRPESIPKLTEYTPTRFMLPTSHYDQAKADRAVRFIENLKHTRRSVTPLQLNPAERYPQVEIRAVHHDAGEYARPGDGLQ